MAIFVGLDVHRAQITYDAFDTVTGEVRTGRIRPANRGTVRAFLARLATKETIVAVEAMTGWRFIAEECFRAGIEVRLAEPAETRMRQDRKRRAKTDKLDARLLRELLMQERLPESWIAPAQQQITVALGIIEHLNGELHTIGLELERIARHQPGCRALMGHYGIGPLVATAILAELGDTRRLSSSKQAVRCAGLDITVHESDTRRRAGHLSRQGSPVLRWAAFEAAQAAARPSSPDHDYYVALKDRLGANRAALTIARKLLRRAHHTLRELGDAAIAPA